MSSSLILTVCARDRPGIMSLISKVVADNHGNWLESRMARLAGQFAGIIRIECAKESNEALAEALAALASDEIIIDIHQGDILSDTIYTRCIRINICGNDRPGIVSQLTRAISRAGANIDELNTSIESAAMSGHEIFHVSGIVCLPDSTDEETLITEVENLSDDLNVEISEHS